MVIDDIVGSNITQITLICFEFVGSSIDMVGIRLIACIGSNYALYHLISIIYPSIYLCNSIAKFY